jgi:hypothetical protein
MLADTIVALALAREGASFGDPARRPEYLAHQYPGDTPFHAREMGSRQSGCLLFARGCLAHQRRADGTPELDGSITWRGRSVDALQDPYAGPLLGAIEGLLQEYGRQRGVLITDAFEVEDLPALVTPGDILAIGNLGQPPTDSVQREQWRRSWGGLLHGIVVTGRQGLEVERIEGGKTDPLNSSRPTAIRRGTGALERRADGWWLREGASGARRCNWLLRTSTLVP